MGSPSSAMAHHQDIRGRQLFGGGERGECGERGDPGVQAPACAIDIVVPTIIKSHMN